MNVNRRQEGSDAEDRAAEFLDQLGYTLVTRRWTGKRGELDIVALHGETLVFVEVKFRRKADPELAISGRKHDALIAVADEFAREFELGGRPQRFDLVAVDLQQIRHHRDILRD